MRRFVTAVRKLVPRSEEGASVVEYAFLLALLALLVLTAMTLLGQSISSLFSKLGSYLTTVGN